ncbi:hypothetical protein DFS33DRAFT_1269998 [Desarmillaria ectypa]|nr:hypothetical protein DFS33DRAFT_1269998 [Desarmillaria ectypa]
MLKTTIAEGIYHLGHEKRPVTRSFRGGIDYLDFQVEDKGHELANESPGPVFSAANSSNTISLDLSICEAGSAAVAVVASFSLVKIETMGINIFKDPTRLSFGKEDKRLYDGQLEIFNDWWSVGKQWDAPMSCCVTWEIDEDGGRKRMHTWRCLTTHVSTNRTVPYVDTSQWTPYNPYPVYRPARRQYPFRSNGNYFLLPQIIFCVSVAYNRFPLGTAV